MFTMSPMWEKFFYFLTYIAQGPSFLNPTSYSILHQKHHAYSDTPKDPHSPVHSKSLWDMSLKTYSEYKYLIENHKDVKDSAVINKSPIWPTLDNFAETKYNIFFWVLLYMGVYYMNGIEPQYYLFIFIHGFMGPIQGAIVNWFGHKVGYRNYNLNDNSKNTLPFDFALMGELYQNNHHRYGNKMNFAHKWFEVDITFQISRLLNLLKIIQIKST